MDFSIERLNLLQMEHGERGLRIRAAASVPYPEDRERLLASPAQLKALLRQARQGKPFQGRRVVTALPAPDVKLINLSYESVANVGDDTVILRTLKSRLSGDLQDWVVDYLPIRREDPSAGENSALVAAARRETVLEFLETLRRSGLEVEALEVGPVAIRRLVASMGGKDHYGNSLIVNFGREKSYVSVIWGRRLVLNREMDFGENQLLRKLSQELDLPLSRAQELPHECGVFHNPDSDWGFELRGTDDEAARSIMEILKPVFLHLVEEVQKALIYTSSLTRGGSVENVYLFGGVARWPGADRLLSSLLSIPVEIPNPFAAFLARSDAAVLGDLNPIAGISLAAGFALRGMLSDG